jgi:hypothetical protein
MRDVAGVVFGHPRVAIQRSDGWFSFFGYGFTLAVFRASGTGRHENT